MKPTSTQILKVLWASFFLLLIACKEEPMLENVAATNSSATHNGVQPSVVDPNLNVTTVIGGLITPTSLAFLGTNDFLVLEKNTGQVKRVTNGVVTSVVLDLAVNFASERGLLGIALHPNFPSNSSVYLYWTESTNGSDTNVLSQTPLLGNRVDRFMWNGTNLTIAENIIKVRAYQQDEGQPLRGNHDGGVIRFGPDGKLYVFIGDVGRRGQTQNLPKGPFGNNTPDDQFGGPEPDNAHLTGVILRLNADGSTPSDNPFFSYGAGLGGEVGANVQKIFSFGHRNSFGMAFDPKAGYLWLQENGDDSFTELNRVLPGTNGGWVQIAGPVSRIAQFKQIETSEFGRSLQQIRWSPTNIANTPAEAMARLFRMPGARYTDPEFSWKYEIAPAGIGFINGNALGSEYDGNLLMGAASGAAPEGGHLFLFNFNTHRTRVQVDDPRLADRVADNLGKNDLTESESLLFGRNFGISTDIETGPNGNVFVVSLSHGAVFEISKAP